MNILDSKQRAEGFKRFQDWLADHPEARKEAKKAILEINQKYNMMKIGEGND